MEFTYAPGQTPIDPDEAAGLIPKHITTQALLDEWEQANILAGSKWAAKQKGEILDENFVRELHRRMFGKTWKWAGTFRVSDKNIGVDWRQVPIKLRNLLDNTRYQIEHKVFPPDELAVRFHRDLVWIHAFPNGNGRHARLMTDLLIMWLGRERFTWGGNELVAAGAARAEYLAALREADQNRFERLVAFARS